MFKDPAKHPALGTLFPTCIYRCTGIAVACLQALACVQALASPWSTTLPAALGEGSLPRTHHLSEIDGDSDEEPSEYRGTPPIIPGLEGYGTNNFAGSGRHLRPPFSNILRVTRLDDSGRGTLRDCIDRAGPRTCLFQVGGEIALRSALRIREPYLTIAGQSAPAPGITISGGTVRVETHDVLIQHLSVRPGDRTGGVEPAERDGITIGAEPPRTAHHVVIDHVSVTWAIDENISTCYRGTRDITISNSIMAEGLDDSIHPKGKHSKGLLIGDGSRRITVIRSLIANNIERNPYLKPGASLEFINNVVYGWGPKGGWSLCNVSDNGGSREAVRLSFLGNYYKPGPWSYRGPALYGKPIAPGTRIFVRGNIGPTRASQREPEWSISSIPEVPYRALSNPLLRARRTVLAAEQAYERVLATAGARPRRRAKTDARIISDVRNGSGGIRDCIVGCTRAIGELENLPTTSAPMDLPAQGTKLAIGEQYTNLERWLHERARQVEEGS